MKKTIMLALMLLMLAVSAVCSAANGKILDAEEAIAAKFSQATSYKAVSPSMTAEMQTDWTETAFNNLHAQLAKDFGTLTTHKLRVLEKYDDADVLTYQVACEKIPRAEFIYVFTLNGEKPLLKEFRILLPKPQEEAPKSEQK